MAVLYKYLHLSNYFQVTQINSVLRLFLKNNWFVLLQEYGAGRMLTGEVKQRLIEVLTKLVERHCRARAAVTDEVSFLHRLLN